MAQAKECVQAGIIKEWDACTQVDHLRAVGPGVYVGVGWRHLGTAKAERFLHFMLVRKCDA